MKIIPYDTSENSQFDIDGDFNKIIKVPCIHTNKCAEKYKHLNLKSIIDYNNEIAIDYIYIIKENDTPTGAVLVYEDALKPNEYFLFSKKLIEKLIDDDEFEYFSSEISLIFPALIK